jgi:hypothetical protein
MLKAYFNTLYLFPKAKVEVEITRHGYHVLAWGVNLPFEEECKVRITLGDDRARVHLDEYKKTIGSHNFNVLWTNKRGFGVRQIEPV